jgi:cell shape-determining protein MreC
MTYHQRNKRSTLGAKVIIGFVVIIILLRIFNVNMVDGLLKNSFNYVLESKSTALVPLRNSLVYFRSKSGLEEENKKLRTENTDLKLRALTADAVSQEFEEFKSQFEPRAEDEQPVKVILRPPFVPFDIIRLSGNLEQYAEGSLVFYKSVVIGSLVEKTGRYGSVELYSTPGKITPASVKGQQFEAKGLGGGRYLIEVPKDMDVKEGDPVLFPSEQVLLLGVVGQLESNEEDLFKKVFFNLPTPLDSMQYVTIGMQQHYEQSQPTQ